MSSRPSCPANSFARNEVRSPKTEVKLRFQVVPRNPFARHDVRSLKTEVKLRFPSCPAQPFRTKWGSIVKNWNKNAISRRPRATLSHERRFDRQKTAVKLRFQLVRRNPSARKEVRSPKTAVKLWFQVVPLVPRTLSHGMRLRLCVKASV